MSETVVETKPMPDPKNASHRTKAHKLRARVRRGETLMPSEAQWLNDYNAAQAAKDNEFTSSRKVVHMEEETTDASGEAATAAAMPMVSRNEGRRLDYILDLLIRSQSQVVTMYEKLCGQVLARNAQMEEVHIAMLDSIREHYLARISAEADNMVLNPDQDKEPDALEQFAQGAMAAIAGKMQGGKRGAKPPTPPTEGEGF